MTREEAIEHVEFLCDNACNYYLGRENTIALYMALEALKQESRPTGKWLPYEYGDERWHKCSNCGKPSQYRDYYKAFDGKTYLTGTEIQNYCRYCGAKMDEEQ